MDPAIGASTWALGNHRCTENIGSLTKNPPIKIIEHVVLDFNSIGRKNSDGRLISMCPDVIFIIQKSRNIGKDAVTVYIIKYILACIRSGWYPHSIIMNIVGIREASNQI
jgi:hypothetical protein